MSGRHTARSWRRRLGLGALVGAIVLAVLGGGGAYAAYRYERSQEGRILPGVTIAGVDVGGMLREEAVAAVSAAADRVLDREIEVTAGERAWHVTPKEMGSSADVEAKVDAALAIGEDLPWYARAFRRVLDRPLGESLALSFRREPEPAKRFLDVVARAVYRSPHNAAIRLEDGRLVVERPRRGAQLEVREARRRLIEAIRTGGQRVRLPVERVGPEVEADELGMSIVVRLSEKRLYVYDGVKVVKTYPVATGQPGYATPAGTWTVWDKRANPTWVNPAPDGWGRDLPRVIGPGPGNPLGTHALYLDAPGIRIHGTYDAASIGTYASHGCIRMHLSDAEELFGMIEVGTQVHVLW